MRAINFFGTTSCLVPKTDGSLPLATVEGKFTNNKMIFFGGAVPSTDELYTYSTEAELTTVYTPIAQISGVIFDYYQDNTNLKRTIKKNPDVKDLPYETDGTITWCAIVLDENVNQSDDAMLFTDSIGTVEEEGKYITLESLTGVTGDTNLLRDFSVILTEKSTSEV